MGINIIIKHATEQKGWGRRGDRVLKSTKVKTEKKRQRTERGKREQMRKKRKT